MVHKQYKHENVNQDIFKCDECEIHFSMEKSLNRHMKEVHKETFKNLTVATIYDLRFTCDECEDIFPRNSNLIRHKETVHKAGNKNFLCPNCQKPFSRKDNLKKHISKNICKLPY